MSIFRKLTSSVPDVLQDIAQDVSKQQYYFRICLRGIYSEQDESEITDIK